MKEKDSFNIRWTQITSNTFMYGTQFRFHASETVFQNELMPSGIVIHQWEMMTNFQKDKTIPTLPILKKDQTYHFKFDYDVEPSHCIYFKIIFKHRDNTVCDVQIIRGHEAEVRMPQQAFNYELQMINAASKVVKFRQICIKEGEDAQLDNQLYISDIQNKVPHLPIVNIVFVEKKWSQQQCASPVPELHHSAQLGSSIYGASGIKFDGTDQCVRKAMFTSFHRLSFTFQCNRVCHGIAYERHSICDTTTKS